MESIHNSLQQGVDDERSARERRDALVIQKAFPLPGTLGLSALLDEKRVRHGIPAVACLMAAVYNKILVWQIPIDEAESYGGGAILKTDTAKARERSEAPRGVIVSAGLQALDELRSNGIDIGHTVFFTHLAPFRRRLPTIAGRESALVILHSGDIFESEELAENLRSRTCRIVTRVSDEGTTEHFYCDANGKVWKPLRDVASEDG